MSDGERILTMPRHNPVNAFTMGGIVRDAGLTAEEFLTDAGMAILRAHSIPVASK
jgi:hypothetical protein